VPARPLSLSRIPRAGGKAAKAWGVVGPTVQASSTHRTESAFSGRALGNSSNGATLDATARRYLLLPGLQGTVVVAVCVVPSE
jgi:hypothetical protein